MSNIVVKHWRRSKTGGKFHALFQLRDGRSFGYIDSEQMIPVGDPVVEPPDEEKCGLCVGYIKRNQILTIAEDAETYNPEAEAIKADLCAVLEKHDVILQVLPVDTGIGPMEKFVATDQYGTEIAVLNPDSGCLSAKDLK